MRANLRYYTCILYLNDDWKPEDGGALRIYPGSCDVDHPTDAVETMDYADVFPVNQRLVIFDSMLVHSVEKVKSPEKLRRALTIWIIRPDDSVENWRMTS
jgi:Rps23 Pro-64 3,4-dihydroxylase Tpa1-like proline 4-hydroxylase